MDNYLRIYAEKFLFLEKFMRTNLWHQTDKKDHEFAQDLCINSCKCLLIAHVLLFGFQFSKGKQFYLVYLKTSLKASMFGFLYSVYFNDEKLELYLAKKKIA